RAVRERWRLRCVRRVRSSRKSFLYDRRHYPRRAVTRPASSRLHSFPQRPKSSLFAIDYGRAKCTAAPEGTKPLVPELTRLATGTGGAAVRLGEVQPAFRLGALGLQGQIGAVAAARDQQTEVDRGARDAFG